MKQYHPGDDLSSFQYLLLGDLSGIQDFIFDVQSEGAAKTLKGRSFFVQTLSNLCLKRLEDTLSPENCLLLYNGGGNFYVFCRASSEAAFSNLRSAMDEALRHDSLYLSLSYCRFNETTDRPHFSKVWANIQARSREDKQQPFSTDIFAFSPFPKPPEEPWKALAEGLKSAKSMTFRVEKGARREIGRHGISFAGVIARLDDKPPAREGENIRVHWPLWHKTLEEQYKKAIDVIQKNADATEQEELSVHTGGIIPFNFLSKFAWQRTGTDKLGILKMDADNLGARFGTLEHLDQVDDLSKRLNVFFSKDIAQILQSEFGSRKDRLSDHIYPVFIGGDDCFFIGGWDAIVALAPLIRRAFHGQFGAEGLSISAGLVMAQGKFPVVRFADQVEAALSDAKRFDAAKNRIAVFGEVLTWGEYDKAVEWANKLKQFVEVYQQPKTILRRVQRAKTGFDRLSRHAADGHVSHKKVWRLGWFLRSSVKDKDSKVKEFVDNLVSECSESILDACFGVPSEISPGVFTVAGRLAEFMTREPKEA